MVATSRDSKLETVGGNISRYIIFRQALASLADNFSSPYIGYYLASLTPSGVGQGVLQFSTNALPTLAQVVVGPFLDRFGRYVLALLLSSTVASIMWLAVSLTVEPTTFIALITTRAVFVGLTSLAFTAFVGALFDHSERGRILSGVNVASQLATLIVLILTATIINPSIEVLRYLFLLSGVVSLAASLLWIKVMHLDRHTAIRIERSGSVSLRSTVADIGSNKSFMKFTALYASHIMTMAIAWPWFPLTQRYILNMSVAEIAVLNICGTLTTMISQYILGRYLSRSNLRKLIIVGRLGFVIPPLFYSVARDATTIYISSILLSPFSAICNVAIPLYVYRVAQHGMYASYTAFLNFSQGILAATGSIVGGVIADAIIGSGGFENLRYALALDAVVRLMVATLFTRVDDV